eukprot:scaffold335197_cov18-Prasinocladus_malaysianus.AAC.1
MAMSLCNEPAEGLVCRRLKSFCCLRWRWISPALQRLLLMQGFIVRHTSRRMFGQSLHVPITSKGTVLTLYQHKRTVPALRKGRNLCDSMVPISALDADFNGRQPPNLLTLLVSGLKTHRHVPSISVSDRL